MKVKDGLILRKVAGQFIIVPTGKRVQEITNMVYISSSGAYLWEFMQNTDFTKELLVEKIMEHYSGVTEDVAAADIEKFLTVLKENNVMELQQGEAGGVGGSVRIKLKGPLPKGFAEGKK